MSREVTFFVEVSMTFIEKIQNQRLERNAYASHGADAALADLARA